MKKSAIFFSTCVISVLFCPDLSHAGSCMYGKIAKVISGHQDGYVVQLAADRVVCNSAIPKCATSTSTTNRYYIKISQPGGRALVATMLTAKAMGSIVSIVGTGACEFYPDTESIAYTVVE